MKVNMSFVSFVVAAIVCLGVGSVSAYFQKDGLVEWYPILNKSELTPPGVAFGIIWTVLYLLMAYSISRIASEHKDAGCAIYLIFGVQLFLNFMWSVAFFYYREPMMGLLVLLALLAMVVYYIVVAYKIDVASALCFVPYALWCGFAIYLNYYVVSNN